MMRVDERLRRGVVIHAEHKVSGSQTSIGPGCVPGRCSGIQDMRRVRIDGPTGEGVPRLCGAIAASVQKAIG